MNFFLKIQKIDDIWNGEFVKILQVCQLKNVVLVFEEQFFLG